MGATALDPAITTPLVGQQLAGEEVASAVSRAEFGYILAEPATGGWRLTVHDVAGKPEVVCEIQGTTLKCAG